MSAQLIMTFMKTAPRTHARRRHASYDSLLLGCTVILLALGLVMIASASLGIADKELNSPWYYLNRQGLFVVLGLLAGFFVSHIPLEMWRKSGPILLLAGMALLLLILVPGVGRTVNGSTRWIGLGPFNLQVSEVVKLFMVIYLAGYLVRHGDVVRNTIGGFIKPMAVVVFAAFLLLLEPDFGAATVLAATALGMMFLGGVRLWLFAVLMMSAVGGMAVLAITSPYRMERLTSFLNPWADPFNSGFQLTQALIAFGRGEWFGVGLGGSVQKLFYLPEAHTDFLFAVLAEELGMFGATGVVILFSLLVWRGFHIGRVAQGKGNLFGAYLAFGLALWLAMQAFINMGVNMGLLPTKGLTLPLMSYGGSSIIVTCIAVALLLRVGYESGASIRSGGRP